MLRLSQSPVVTHDGSGNIIAPNPVGCCAERDAYTDYVSEHILV